MRLYALSVPTTITEHDMAIYREARAWTYFHGAQAADSYDCEVRLGQDGSIAVGYESENGRCLYLGSGNGDGHFVLTCEEVRGRASLHRFDDSLILEGYWEESGERGMWRIELGETSDAATGMEEMDELPDDWGDESDDDKELFTRHDNA